MSGLGNKKIASFDVKIYIETGELYRTLTEN